MAALARLCTECQKPLTSKSVRALTCSQTCRAKRSRRLKNQTANNSPAVTQEAQTTLAALARGETSDAVRDVIRQEIGPVVRQALTEDTLAAVRDLIGLTPLAVAVMQEDLTGEDTTIRQRAYQTLLRYTVGHNAIVKPEDTDDKSQIVVNFNLPRPDAPGQDEFDATDETQQIEAIVYQECDMCHIEKPIREFELGSTRCTQCFDAWKKAVVEQFS